MESEKKPGLKFVYYDKGDILERTVGKLLAVPTQNLTQGTYGSIFKDVPTENIDWLAEKFKDVKWQGDVEVHLNHSPLWRQLERLFDKERPRSLFSRVAIGIPVTLLNSITGRLFNWNLYNPYADIVQLYSENKFIDLGKIGIAEYIHERSDKNNIWQELLSFANSIPVILNTLLFLKTNAEALKKLNDEERNEGAQYLVSSSASEGIVDAVALVTMLSAGASLKDTPTEELTFGKLAGDVVMGIFDPVNLAIGASVAGGITLYSELTKDKNMNIGDLFDENVSIESVSKKKKKKEELSKVLVDLDSQLAQLAG